MWSFKDFIDYMSQTVTNHRSKLDQLYDYAKEIGDIESFNDDFTIVEVTFDQI